MKVYRFMSFLMLAALMLASLAACAPTAAPTTAPVAPAAGATEVPAAAAPSAADSTLVIVMNTDDAMTFDPAVAGETTNLFVFNTAYDQLTEIKAGDLGTVQPKVADSWEYTPDLKTFTFKLHPGIKFASGNPLTAADVVFTYQRIFNMKGAAAANIEALEKIEALDDMTVKVTLSAPTPAFLAIAANPSLGIQDSVLVKEHGGTDAADADKTDTAKEWLDKNSAGSGAYKLVNWDPKSEFVFEANENYWRGKPAFSKIIIKHVSDPTTALQMLQKGDADLLPSLDYDLVEQAQADPNLVVNIGQSLDMNYLAMNSDPAVSEELANPLVRKAVVAAIDYEGIAKAVLRGYATRAPSVIPVGMPGVRAEDAEGRDVEKAKALLAEAGYPDGITVNLHYGSSPVRETIAAKLKADLAEAGITAELNPMEQSVYLTEMRAQKLPMAFGGWTPDYVDVTMWTHFYSFPDTSIAFRMKYDSPKTAEIAAKIETEMDPAAREELTKQWMAQVNDDMPYTMLYQGQTISAMNKDIKGFAYHPVFAFNAFDLTK